jgi:hypothetical protein
VFTPATLPIGTTFSGDCIVTHSNGDWDVTFELHGVRYVGRLVAASDEDAFDLDDWEPDAPLPTHAVSLPEATVGMATAHSLLGSPPVSSPTPTNSPFASPQPQSTLASSPSCSDSPSAPAQLHAMWASSSCSDSEGEPPLDGLDENWLEFGSDDMDMEWMATL